MKVAVAVISDQQGRILITQRPHHASHGGCWEFPGGKLEQNELAEQALVREIKEEVGLDIHEFSFLGEINHQYTDKTVQLLVFHITHFTGNPVCREGQLDLKWIEKENLKLHQFPEANHAVFDLVPHFLG